MMHIHVLARQTFYDIVVIGVYLSIGAMMDAVADINERTIISYTEIVHTDYVIGTPYTDAKTEILKVIKGMGPIQ